MALARFRKQKLTTRLLIVSMETFRMVNFRPSEKEPIRTLRFTWRRLCHVKYNNWIIGWGWLHLPSPWLFRGEQGWRLPPLWPGFDSRTWRQMWVEFVVGSRPCTEGFSPGSPVLQKKKKPTLQNPIRSGNEGHRFVSFVASVTLTLMFFPSKIFHKDDKLIRLIRVGNL